MKKGVLDPWRVAPKKEPVVKNVGPQQHTLHGKRWMIIIRRTDLATEDVEPFLSKQLKAVGGSPAVSFTSREGWQELTGGVWVNARSSEEATDVIAAILVHRQLSKEGVTVAFKH